VSNPAADATGSHSVGLWPERRIFRNSDSLFSSMPSLEEFKQQLQ